MKASFIGKYEDYKGLLIEMNEDNWILAEKTFHESLWRPANPLID